MREIEKSLTVFKAAGLEIVPLPLPDSFKICNDLANIIAGSEICSAHANWLKQRPDDYGSQTRERLLTGFLVTVVDYLDALKLRKVILAEFLREVFSKVDVLHTPVAPISVPTLAESNIQNNPGFIEYLSLLGHCTRTFDYLGLPILALPAGLTENGMPTGFQLAASPFEESVLFREGCAYERETTWSFPELIFQ
jgi:aspartyl-tRNA(Asn)/glutamyl-tRNA(Gln) amidotransferase subunit A